MNPNQPNPTPSSSTPPPVAPDESQTVPSPEVVAAQNINNTPVDSVPAPTPSTPVSPFFNASNTAAQPGVTPTPNPVPNPAPAAAPVGGGSFIAKLTSNKKLLFGLIGGIIGIAILVVAGILVYQNFFSVTKDDYREASAAVSSVHSDYSDIGAIYLSPSSTPTEISNSVDTMKKAIGSFDSDYKKLSGLKAVRIDGDVSKAFKAVDSKKSAFDDVVNVELEVYEKILPAVSAAQDASDSSSTATDKVNQMKAAFTGISGLKYDVNKKFVADYTAGLTTLAAAAQRYDNRFGSNGSYDSTAITDYYDATDKLSDAVKNWQSNVKKMSDDADISKDFESLDNAIFLKLEKS